MITKLDVSSKRAFDYLKRQVSSSGKTLANHIENLPLEKGKVFSFVPNNTAENELYNFQYGVLYPYDENTFNNSISLPDSSLVPIRNDAKPIVIDLIIQFLRTNENHCCFIEEACAEPSFPIVQKSGIKYSYLQNEMYYFFDQNVDEKEFKEAFKTSQGWYFLCTLGVLSPKKKIHVQPYKELSVDLIRSYVDGLKSFFVSAYDGEGYLQWESTEG